MGNRIAKPIERLLKIKSIDPNYKFVGADARVYSAWLEKQEQDTLLAELRAKEEKRSKNKKVKQVIPEDLPEIGAIPEEDIVEFEVKEAEPVETPVEDYLHTDENIEELPVESE